ncbi:3'-5' exonuclease family protein [Paraburkholderia elongata]|uniref:Uncharacterized protein n=1 Tax=Paraburkholderia elongata TaxID=2675747 RepID=A0A972NLQ3_9BURK|nr:3'-5' exoribonuclease [Paraburkholderia elongata]NPT54589.1 hypothetical protein [Paraburkholderia elongata]
MRVFIDTEFTNLQDRELISVALVAENGDEFYGESSDFDHSRCSEFVRETVLPQLGSPAGRAMPLAQLQKEVMDWLKRVSVRTRPILCYDNDVDLRLLESLIGSFPKGWQQEAGLDAFFAEHGHRHHALWDARANLVCFQSKTGIGAGQKWR